MKNNHTFITELEAENTDLTYKIAELDLLLDIKVLIKEYYSATLTESGNELTLKFNNGQIFKLTLTEQK